MDEAIQEVLSKFSPEVQKLSLALRDKVLSLAPGLAEKPYTGWQNIVYNVEGNPRNIVLAINPLRSYVNLNFGNARELDDPGNLLSGTGKSILHATIRTLEDVENPRLADLISQAARMAQIKK